MALKKYIVDLLQDNPLNGISTYKDVLTLSTGAISRKIRKYEITGLEGWIARSGTPENVFFCERQDVNIINNAAICSHYVNQDSGSFADLQDKHFLVRIASSGDKSYIGIRDSSYPPTNEGVTQLRSFLQQQYANGTPVTIWYALSSETTEQITVPTGLSGTVDGYTTQTGTPTPTAPIYPTANTVTMWANYTPQRYNGNAFVTATGQPEQYNGGWA